MALTFAAVAVSVVVHGVSVTPLMRHYEGRSETTRPETAAALR